MNQYDFLRDDVIESAEIHRFLVAMSNDYPAISDWFWRRVAPGRRNGTRAVFTKYVAGDLVGLGIAKDDGTEKKLCSLRVVDGFQNRGVGLFLLDRMLRWVNTDHPVATVGKHKLPAFQRIFERYGFSQTSEHAGLYVPQHTEIVFNGPTFFQS